MKASELLNEIKKNIKDFPINKLKKDKYKDDLSEGISKYNINSYYEIFNLEISNDYDISDKKIKLFKEYIDYYFSIYWDGEDTYKEFIKYISLYLSFIAKKPLHPVGLSLSSNDADVYEANGKYYCKVKNKHIKEKNSLCKFCVSRFPK